MKTRNLQWGSKSATHSTKTRSFEPTELNVYIFWDFHYSDWQLWKMQLFELQLEFCMLLKSQSSLILRCTFQKKLFDIPQCPIVFLCDSKFHPRQCSEHNRHIQIVRSELKEQLVHSLEKNSPSYCFGWPAGFIFRAMFFSTNEICV